MFATATFPFFWLFFSVTFATQHFWQSLLGMEVIGVSWFHSFCFAAATDKCLQSSLDIRFIGFRVYHSSDLLA